MKKNGALCCIFLLSLSFCLVSCEQRNYPSDDFFAMDTYISVKAANASKEDFKAVRDLIKSAEKTFSRTDSESEIYKLNHGDSVTVSKECASLLSRAALAASDTNGAFDPCLGLISRLWDITGEKHIPADNEIAALLPYCAYDSFTLGGQSVTKKYTQTEIDLGAAVKGYAAGEALRVLREREISDAMISLGGNIAVCGNAEGRSDGWRIGVRSPYFPDTLALQFVCTDRVIAVSGDYERYFEKDGVRYHHIFDPATGKPARTGLRSTVVIAKDGFVSDMLSTALFVMGAQKSADFYMSGCYDFEAILFTDDGKVLATDGIIDALFLADGAATQDGTPLEILPLSKE